jgi:hypothetical protein
MDQRLAHAQAFTNAKSVCRCGHTGDDNLGSHAGQHDGSVGHGRCLVAGCRCEKFTWNGYTDEFNAHMAAYREQHT